MSLTKKPSLPLPREEFRAQRIAWSHLARACEHALFELELEAAIADSSAMARSAKRAAEIINEVRQEWRETLLVLQVVTRPRTQQDLSFTGP